MAGINSLSGSALNKLQAGLASQSAPANSATPNNRTDPKETSLLDLQRIRRALEVAKTNLDDADPQQLLIGAMHGAISRLLSRVDLADSVDIMLEAAYPLASPRLTQRLAAMFSPPIGLGGGATPGPQPPGIPSATGVTGPPFAPAGQPAAPTGSGVPAGDGSLPSAV
jgi:hypothetical protein